LEKLKSLWKGRSLYVIVGIVGLRLGKLSLYDVIVGIVIVGIVGIVIVGIVGTVIVWIVGIAGMMLGKLNLYVILGWMLGKPSLYLIELMG
jgi:hypothetical protein